MNDPFSAREREIFETLKALKDCEFVLIGGYAVNAYTLPRFSADCDIVIGETELEEIEKVLLNRSYVKIEHPELQHYVGSFVRFEKRLENKFKVSVDVLIGAVTDRTLEAVFPAAWVFEHSGKRLLRGKTITEELTLRIINRDALIAMKITACRTTDIRDVFMMAPDSVDRKWIMAEVASRADPRERMARLIEKVSSKEFQNGLGGVFGAIDSKTLEKHRKAVSEFLS